LLSLVRTYRYIYEFDDTQSIDKNYIRLIIDRFTEKSIFVLYSASDYYFAIKEIANRQKDSRKSYCLFILESRTNDYNKNKRQIFTDGIDQDFVELGELEYKDAINFAEKIEILGLSYPKFSEFSLDKRARIILDKERGFSGDILSALYSLTNNHSFEMKIFEDYESASSLLQKNIVNLVSMLHSMSFPVSVDCIAGALEQKVDEINRCVTEDLAGVVVIPSGASVVKCRHRIIATYYFDQYIAHKGEVSILSGLLEYLSRQFTVDDIKFNPLAYRMYRDLISFEFVYDNFFPLESRDVDCERLYHGAQKCFGRDGVFWLHFGRYYRKLDKFVEAIDCFKTGLRLYDSFQTRHSLGMTLVEKYIYEDQIYSDYEEGIEILERQRLLRGVKDAYPTTTMLTLFSRILEIAPGNLDVKERAKNCLNFGMKNFRGDDHFNSASREYLFVERKYSSN
jgi:tetratricopeptide (TPR) repeat protein